MYFSCTSASGVSSGRVVVDDLTYNSKRFLSLQLNDGSVSRSYGQQALQILRCDVQPRNIGTRQAGN